MDELVHFGVQPGRTERGQVLLGIAVQEEFVSNERDGLVRPHRLLAQAVFRDWSIANDAAVDIGFELFAHAFSTAQGYSISG
jgi:hypothetical protein